MQFMKTGDFWKSFRFLAGC